MFNSVLFHSETIQPLCSVRLLLFLLLLFFSPTFREFTCWNFSLDIIPLSSKAAEWMQYPLRSAYSAGRKYIQTQSSIWFSLVASGLKRIHLFLNKIKLFTYIVNHVSVKRKKENRCINVEQWLTLQNGIYGYCNIS